MRRPRSRTCALHERDRALKIARRIIRRVFAGSDWWDFVARQKEMEAEVARRQSNV